MLNSFRILALCGSVMVSAVMLLACGQKGNLYLPTEPAAQQRATLPQTLTPSIGAARPLGAASATVDGLKAEHR